MKLKSNLSILILILSFIGIIINLLIFKQLDAIDTVILVVIIVLSIANNKHYVELLKVKQNLEQKIRIITNDNKTIQKNIEEYKYAFDSIKGTVIFIYKKDHTIYMSKSVEELLGITLLDLNESSPFLHDFIHGDDLEIIKKHEEKLFSGETIDISYRLIHPEKKEIIYVLFKATPVMDSNGSLKKIFGQIVDITARKKMENDLKQLAYFDDLTDLPNRKMLERHLQKSIARSKRHEHNLNVMFIDLDDFKKVNDRYGHDMGDKLLKEVVSRLNGCLRDEDVISRIGGDEFLVIIEQTSKSEVENIAKRILSIVSEPYELVDENSVNISLSIGISQFPENGDDKETLVKNADIAMYYAKNNGKNNYKFYREGLIIEKEGTASLFGMIVNKFFN